MPPPSDPQAAALLAHVLSQTHQNIAFLASQNYITPADAAEITARLSAHQSNSLAEDMSITARREPSPPPPARRIPPPPPRAQRARALWAYNEDGREPNDLSFSSGEIVEVIDETNADWWTGRCRGRQGLFPSNHVEKIAPGPSPPPNVPSPPMPMAQMPPPQPMYAAPMEKPVYNQYAMQPPPPQPVVVQQAPPPEPKKSRFGGLGQTMATSAAGGLGFGAGAAIGSDLINSIF
ncbi:SH3-domain-containing protein [Wolfiporia cocos MD-104 SS10]|uniref:SH3-domain-containing protein n=1 Tax=Wolfiporia cocos (strain MD-104) TaxID=742152 RepID=A0A2H3JKB2_WOLCO|nr:SH3-domain-containing protein [Wolfiporia cocos MD-104 SS10]